MQTLELLNVLPSLKFLYLGVFFSEFFYITFWRIVLFLWLFCQLNGLINFGFFLNFLLNFGNHSVISLFFGEDFAYFSGSGLESKFFSFIKDLLGFF